jgi:hypothetical protein
MPHRWLILGSGGHGRSVADAIRAQVDPVLGFLRLAWVVKPQPSPEEAPTPDRFVLARVISGL